MPLRRLALLWFVACLPAPDPAPVADSGAPAGAPVPSDSPARPGAKSDTGAPVRSDSPGRPGAASATGEPVLSDSPGKPGAASATGAPVPSDSPAGSPRRLHAGLDRFAALADGALLVVPKAGPGAGELHRLDPGSGALTPWAQGWRPAASGWKVADPAADTGFDPHVSPDGAWVALAHVFTPLTAPKPGEDDVFAVVVSRPDGSEARCVGAAILEDEGDPQPFLWTADSRRLIGGWSGRCEPDTRGRLQSFPDGKRLGAWPRPMRWFEPHDGSRGETPGVWSFESRDPLGDVVATLDTPGEAAELAFHDLRSGARLGAVTDPPAQVVLPNGWLGPDTLLVDLYSEPGRDLVGHRIHRTDGRELAATAPGWWVYTRLASGEQLFTRDSGKSIEQGRIDPSTFTVTTSRPRADLARFARPFQRTSRPETWTPALGGVLIHERETGELWLAVI